MQLLDSYSCLRLGLNSLHGHKHVPETGDGTDALTGTSLSLSSKMMRRIYSYRCRPYVIEVWSNPTRSDHVKNVCNLGLLQAS
jgi:hypothetical protein